MENEFLCKYLRESFRILNKISKLALWLSIDFQTFKQIWYKTLLLTKIRIK